VQTIKDRGTGEDFFSNAATQRQPIKSIDYDDDFVYMFTTNDTDEYWYGGNASSTLITVDFAVRRLASRTYQLRHDNIITSDHTKAQGYLEDDDQYVYNATESIRVENEDISDETNFAGTYDTTTGIWSLTGSSNNTSGFPDIPADEYHINLESGEVKMAILPDKENLLFADYDHAGSVPYAWFEDTSVWDAVQEVSSAGDFICYVNETGFLEFRDRFQYHYPVIGTYEDNLQSDGTWQNGQEYTLTDQFSGSAVTNIIPGLEFIVDTQPDPDTGVFREYKRRSFVAGGTTTIGAEGDYDINYDTGEIGWHDASNIPIDRRVRIYYYARDYLFEYSYDSNILNLNYKWSVDDVSNRVTVRGQRYFPSESPISVREVYVVNPGDRVVNTKFSSIKQLTVGANGDLDQKQFDDFASVWRNQGGDPTVDLEFRNKLLGDTAKSREAGKAIRVRAIPCRATGS
jgi:hypothetical protein